MKLNINQKRRLKKLASPNALPSLAPGELIRLVRQSLGMTQSQLARRAGLMNQSHVARIEAGHMDPQWGSVVRLLKALLCEPVLLARPSRDLEALLSDRIRDVARRRVRRTLGTMALEKQEPDAETVRELEKSEEQALREKRLTSIWNDDAL